MKGKESAPLYIYSYFYYYIISVDLFNIILYYMFTAARYGFGIIYARICIYRFDDESVEFSISM